MQLFMFLAHFFVLYAIARCFSGEDPSQINRRVLREWKEREREKKRQSPKKAPNDAALRAVEEALSEDFGPPRH